MTKFKTAMGIMFSAVFLAIALFLTGLAGYQIYDGLSGGKELINIVVKAINTAIISLAIFELGIGIGKEYASHSEEHNTYYVVRRTIVRFVGTVCIALVLEGLIMIIKYSQLELAGNLNYPVAILIGTSVLLMGMGVFLHLTRADCETSREPRTFSRLSSGGEPLKASRRRDSGNVPVTTGAEGRLR